VDGKWLPTTIRAATDLVNWAEGDPERILAQIETWGEVDDYVQINGLSLPNAWVETADLNQDGQPELLFAFPVRQEVCFGDECQIDLCTAAGCGAYLLLFTQENDLYVPVHLVEDPEADWQEWLDAPGLFHVGDVTGDGRIELLIHQEFCGAHTCTSRLLIGSWDGTTWHDYGSMGRLPLYLAWLPTSKATPPVARKFRLMVALLARLGLACSGR
jgi:hypothetical protein